MTPLEDDLREAMRATAKKIPPGPPPPLTLPERRRIRSGHVGWSRPQGWREWAIPLAAVVLVGAVVAGSLALASILTRFQNSASGVQEVPAYYVALTSVGGRIPDVDPGAETATIRATVTGEVVATIAVPYPYIGFTGVAAAADDRTFVLVAQAYRNYGPGTNPANVLPPARLYVLNFDPDSPTAADRVRLQALPDTYVPPGSEVQSMALSPNGTSLAASIGPAMRSTLYVFNLTTGKRRPWSWSGCIRCPGTQLGGGYVNLYPGVLSWTADGKTLALVFQYSSKGSNGEIRLLDTGKPGTSIRRNSKLAVTSPSSEPFWHEVMITPDGRTILAVQELDGPGRDIRQQLVTFSATTGKLTAVLNQPPVGTNFEQVYWTDNSGHILLISGAQKGGGAGVLNDGRYTPIPWSTRIFSAAW